jgi:hypothetical protein
MTRSFTVIDVPQRSPEWFAARCGRLTGSCAADMLATIKSGEAAARRDLRMRLVCERLTGQAQEDGYVNAVMQRGIDLEPAALAAYEAVTGQFAETTGFLSHTSLMTGCSLDGHLGDFEGVVSLKCPKSATHLGYLRSGSMPTSYVPQMLHELWITGAEFYDFLSYDPRFEAPLSTFYVRVLRSDVTDQIEAYAEKACAFLSEVDAEVAAVRGLAARQEVA